MSALRSAIALALIVVSVLGSAVFAARPAANPVRPFAAASAAAPGDSRWDDHFSMEFGRRFSNGGYNWFNSLEAAAVFRGELYVAGRFQEGSEVDSLWNIARWNGRQWKPLGAVNWHATGGLYDLITDLVVHEDKLYITGRFVMPQAQESQNIASWDGERWSGVGTGLDGPGTALASYGGDLYVGGNFSQGADSGLGNVARWDGTAWHAVGASFQPESYPSARIHALLGTPQGLYAVGSFARSGTQELHTLALWDGSQWSAPMPNLRGSATSLVWHDGALYVGGSLSLEGGGPAGGGLLRWDGAQGEFFIDGLAPGAYVHAVSSIGGELYLSVVGRLYRWNGTAWEVFGRPLAAGTAARDMIAYNNTLNLIGNIECLPADCTARYVLAWTGANWTGLGEGVSSQGVSNLAVVGDAFYASSGSAWSWSEQMLGSQRSYNLGRWDTAGWHDVSFGANTDVTSLLSVGSSLYAARGVYNSGSTGYYTSTIARLEGGVWTTLPGVFGGTVNMLAYSDGSLYAGGKFWSVDGIQTRTMARWDGATWAALGDPQFYEVTALAVHGGAVYVAATTGQNQGYAVVSRWDGATWTVLGTVYGPIEDMAMTPGGDLYIAGHMGYINNVEARIVARWRAGAWEALPNDFQSLPSVGSYQSGAYALEIGADGALYMGGLFASAGTPAMKNIARYDGTWTPLGSGIDGAVLDLEVSGGNLYVGGLLSKAGDKGSANVAIWHMAPNAAPQAAADTATALRDRASNIAVLANDSDADQDGLLITSMTAPSHGVAQVVGATVRYTPAANFVGSDSFSYTISDGVGGKASATVLVTVIEPTSVIFMPVVRR
jgi:trimeric autotransporter adhesin